MDNACWEVFYNSSMSGIPVMVYNCSAQFLWESMNSLWVW